MAGSHTSKEVSWQTNAGDYQIFLKFAVFIIKFKPIDRVNAGAMVNDATVVYRDATIGGSIWKNGWALPHDAGVNRLLTIEVLTLY